MDTDTGTRRCRLCQQFKPIADFPSIVRNGTTRSGSYCRPCKKTYQHEWYLKNREHALARAADRRAAARALRPPIQPRLPLPEAVGFRAHANPRVQGDAGLGVAIAYFTRIGATVAIPLTDSQRYDLILDQGARPERVQVKTTTLRQGNGYAVHLATIGGNKSQTVARVFDPEAYEWLFVVCGDATAYLIPTSVITARYQLFLSRKYEPYRIKN
jgi:hypothetical protein